MTVNVLLMNVSCYTIPGISSTKACQVLQPQKIYVQAFVIYCF